MFLLFASFFYTTLAFTPGEIDALQAMANIPGCPSEWKTQGPLKACDPGWEGIGCDTANTTIIGLGFPQGCSGLLPTKIGQLTSLTMLTIGGTKFFGTIPTELGALTALRSLVLSYNNFVGTFPTELNQLEALKDLGVGGNQLTGTIPTITLPVLQRFNAEANKFTGSLPVFPTANVNLQYLDLSVNSLDGDLSLLTSYPRSLQTLLLSSNLFSGSMDHVAFLTSLTRLDLSSNSLGTTIPTFFGNFPALRILALQSNRFTGSLPSQLGAAGQLNTLRLGFNVLSGTLPDIFRRPTTRPWDLVDVRNNFLSGPFPKMETVYNFNPSNNYFSGVFPSSVQGINPRWRVLYNQTCCCALSCAVCSARVCPLSLAQGDNILFGQNITTTGPLVVGNATVIDSSVISAPNLVQRETVILINSTISVPGVFTVAPNTTLVLSESNISAGNIVLGPGSQLIITGNSTINAETFVISGALTTEQPTPAVVAGCFYTGENASLVVDLSGQIGETLNDVGSVQVVVVQSSDMCIAGGFQNVSLLTDACINVMVQSSTSSISALLSACQAPVALISGITAAGTALIIIVIIALVFYWKFTKSYLEYLPGSLRWQWEQFFINPLAWKHLGDGQTKVHYKKLVRDSPEWQKMMQIKNHALNGQDMTVQNAYALFNPSLVQSFVNSREVKRTRFLTSPNLFLKKTWQKEAPVAQKSILKHRIALAIENSNAASLAAFQQTGSVTELTDFELSQIQTTSLGNAPTKQWVYDRFQQRVQRCDWNTGEIVPILATAHGTDESTSWKIAQTGFASLSLLDSGYYGRGIYFTSFALYCYPYVASKRSPCIVISYVVPGNVFPVNEHHQSFNSKMGNAIESGYDSHYVTTLSTGEVPPSTNFPEGELYDELVISSETSIAPAYLLTLDDSNFGEISKKFRPKFIDVDLEEDARSPIDSKTPLISAIVKKPGRTSPPRRVIPSGAPTVNLSQDNEEVSYIELVDGSSETV